MPYLFQVPKLYQGRCHSSRFSRMHTNQPPSTVVYFQTTHFYLCLCMLFAFAQNAAVCAEFVYGAVKLSAHLRAEVFEVRKRWEKTNNSKVIKRPHRDIKFNLVGRGVKRTSEGHRQVNGRHRFA